MSEVLLQCSGKLRYGQAGEEGCCFGAGMMEGSVDRIGE